MDIGTIAVIGLVLNAIGLGAKIAWDRRGNKKSGNPHYCLYEKQWGEVTTNIDNIKDDIDEIKRSLKKLQNPASLPGGG